MDVTVKATAKEHNITVDNPSTASKDEEKVEPISLGVRKNYSFEGFNISDEAPKKLTQFIYDYSEWIADGLLKHHAGRKQNDERYKVNKSSLGFDMFKFVVALPRMKNWFYLMSQPQTCWNDEIEKGVSGLYGLRCPSRPGHSLGHDEQYRYTTTNCLYKVYINNTYDRDCGPFVAAYAEYLSDGLQVPNDELEVRLLRKRYAALLWKYGEAKAQKPYAIDIKYPRRPKMNSVAPNEEQLDHID
ncbi:hypothetical protein CQW23_04714 [Capsicum baccatum]|uniref:Ubiquitin-like protease family profile domain-containing protein n=1 Tax=Capsicum baccatum TaxID=33114 RepID=A0A2G2XFF7_CAPBA|nr:hypothetical protein CQW23_04714 [Capsicum baccatum]